MKITLVPGQQLSNDLVCAWDRIREANSELGSPYFDPEFTKVIAAVRGDVEVAVVESEGKIVAFFPFQREQRALATPVGGIISDYHGMICARDFRFSPMELLRHCRLTAWDFDHLPVSQESFLPFQLSVEASPQMDLSGGYDAYFKIQGLENFQQIKKKMRRLEKQFGQLRFVNESHDEKLLKAVLAWKSLQYEKTGKQDLFAMDWVNEALHRIFLTRTDRFSGVLSLLYAGDCLIAGHFGMRSKSMWHYWFPSYDLQSAENSPGLILLLKMAQQAPKLGLSIIDLGKGSSPYKDRLMNSSSLVASGSVELKSWRSFRRRTWRTVRSKIGSSPLGPAMRAALDWLRDRGGRTTRKQSNGQAR